MPTPSLTAAPNTATDDFDFFGETEPLKRQDDTERDPEEFKGRELEIPKHHPRLSEDALHGLAGDIVRKLRPNTESHPAALLIEILMSFGNVIDRTAFYQVEDTQHFANLFAVKVGATSKSRKGTASNRISKLFEMVDLMWSVECKHSGLGSGEGLISKVRDELLGEDENGELKVIEPAAKDKRAFFYEGEFAQQLTTMKREGSILSQVIRNAWDGKVLESVVKNSQNKATGAHVSILGDITAEELLKTLSFSDSFNGFANRFLWLHVERVRENPFGGEEIDWTPEIARLRSAVEHARQQKRVFMTRNAREMWYRAYSRLAESQPGLLGAVTSRSEAQVIRVALIYALLDGSEHIDSSHLKAALALWQYVEDSARFIFNGATREQQRILEYLSAVEEPTPKSRIRREVFHDHRSAEQVNDDLQVLLQAGRVRSTTRGTAECFYLARSAAHER